MRNSKIYLFTALSSMVLLLVSTVSNAQGGRINFRGLILDPTCYINTAQLPHETLPRVNVDLAIKCPRKDLIAVNIDEEYLQYYELNENLRQLSPSFFSTQDISLHSSKTTGSDIGYNRKHENARKVYHLYTINYL